MKNYRSLASLNVLFSVHMETAQVGGRTGALDHVDFDTKCIKLADLSQTIWLIHSHSGPSEQGVEGRDQWHNRLCQTASQNAPTICGDNPDAISSIMGSHSTHKQT